MISPPQNEAPKVRDSRTPEPPLPELTREVMAENGFLLPHYRSFTSIYNAASKMYSYRWDEAYKAGRENALAMRRDAYLQSLLQERLKPLRNWPVDIKLVNEKQANDESEQIRQTLLGIHAKTKFSGQQRYYLGNAIWYGRYASQVEYVKLPVDGMPRWCTPNHLPVNGDKIQVGWDGSYGVLINNTFRNDYPDIRVSDAGSAIMMLTRKDMRRRFIIHKYNIEDADFWEGDMAGRVGGIGLRDYCYWAWWLRDEMISWLVTFMEKAGSMGILLFYYQSGSAPAKAKAEQSAREVGGGNALAIPVPAGDPRVGSVELIAANTGGAQFLVDAISDWFERHIERLIVGQSMSGGKDSGDGLGGTGRAEFAKDTKFQLLLSDAKDLAETLTYDWLHQVQELNDLGWGKYEFRFELCVPDPEAKDKLAAVQTATSFGVDFEKDEVRELTGLRKPRPGVETVGGQQPGAGGIGPDGMPVPGGPGQPPADGANPGNQANPTDEGAGVPHPEGENEVGDNPAEGAGVPHPGEANVPPEVLAAMATLAERGDWAGVEELQQLASDPEGLQAFLEDDGDEPANVEYAAVHYQWTAAQTKSGKVKAVWAGGGRAPLYGKRAEAALRAKDGKPAEAKPNTKQMLIDRKKAAEPGRETARQEWQRALTSGVNSEQLPQLVEHLHNLTRNELREMVRGLEQKVGGLKTDLVQRLVDHASSRPIQQPPASPHMAEVASKTTEPVTKTAADSVTSKTPQTELWQLHKKAKAEGPEGYDQFLDAVIRWKGSRELRSLAMDMGVSLAKNPNGKGTDTATDGEIAKRMQERAFAKPANDASSRPTPDQVDMGIDAMDQGKTGPLPRQREDRPDPAIAEAEARNAVDQGQRAKQAATPSQPSATEAAPPTDKAPWHFTKGEIGKSGIQFYKTGQGSIYAMHPQSGQTIRVKSLHTGHDQKDTGLKKGSEKTVYIDPEHGKELGMWQTSSAGGKRIILHNGHAHLVSKNSATGQYGLDKKFKYDEKPSMGRSPLELNNASSLNLIPGQESAWSGNHPGSPITSMIPAEEGHEHLIRAAVAAGKPVPPEVLADYPDLAAKASGQETAKPKSIEEMTAGLHAMAAEQVQDHLPILEKQMDNEVNPRKKWVAANRVLDGLNPAAQKVLLQHIRDTQPDVFAEAKAKASPSMKGVIDQAMAQNQ